MYRKTRNNIKKIFQILLPAATWILLWSAAAHIVNQELLLPSPMTVAVCLSRLIATSEFWLTTGLSLLRVFGGLFAGGLLGILIAVLTSFCQPAHWILAPLIRTIRATPVVSFIVLVLLWTARDYVPVVISTLMVLPVMWENIRTAITSTDRQLLEMAQVYQISRGSIIKHIYFPSCRTGLKSGLQNSCGLAWKSGIATEVICLPHLSIGRQVYNSKIYLETPSLFAWTLTVIVLSLVIEWLLKRLLEKPSKNH